MQTLCRHLKKVRFNDQKKSLSISFLEFSQRRNLTMNHIHSSYQESCMMFLLVSWEEETQNLVSVAF